MRENHIFKALLTILLMASTHISIQAIGIEGVGASIELLPSTYYSNADWEGLTYTINFDERINWGEERECLGNPPADARGREWFHPMYNPTNGDFEWTTQRAPFASAEFYKGLRSYQWCVDMNVADIYIRRPFTLNGELPKEVYLACGHDDGESHFYINGTLVRGTDTGWDESEFIQLTPEQKALLKTDGTENIIAMHVHNNYGGAFADCGLYATPNTANIGNLPMGYNKTWTARLLFNSEGGYAGNNSNIESDIHGWSKLYEAQPGDVYQISMPTPVSDSDNGRVQFKTPITIQDNHTYRFKATLSTNRSTADVVIKLSENEEDETYFFTESYTLEAKKETQINESGIQGTDIQDMKLALYIATSEENTKITLSGISLYDETEQKELWVGTSYYNYCFYRDEDSWTRIKDMTIEGRVETLTWTDADFDDSMWAEAEMPIGNWGYMSEVKTVWPGGDNTNYWIRRNFQLDEVKNSTAYYINVCHDDSYSIYVNGHLIDSQQGWTDGKNPIKIEIPAKYLRVGNNVIATYIQQNWGGKFYDCGMSIVEDAYDEGDIGVDIPASLIATEVNVANIDQTIDHSWNYGGWVEVYNKSDKRISLRYLYISDDANDLKKFILPDVGVVEPHGYRCIFFDHNAADGQYGDQATKQVPFKLSTEGGQIFLSEDGRTPFLTISYPQAIARCSWAKKDLSGDEWGYNGDPTPEAANNESTFADFRMNAPEVDTDSRLFTNPFDVRVTIPTGATLRYTTDGTTPTLQNGTESQEGLFHISETTSLRLRLFQNGYLPSQVITRTYIYQDNDYYLPIIAITTNPDNLYDNTIGVYIDGTNGVSGRNHGKSNINMDWERPVNFEYITPDGKMVINQEAEFVISGGWSRHYAPSSFKLKATKIYEGTTSFDYPFFRYKPYNKYKQLQIRNGGNDNNSHEHGRVRDAITQQILISNGFYIDAQDYQPVHVFFNGEYVAQLNLREPNNRYNGTANYGYDDDEMDAFEYSNGYFQMAGTKDAFNEWLSLSRRATDDVAYEELRQLVDMDEVINFFAGISYIGCSDWICNHNNVKGYRTLPDGKFHLVLHDQDWGWSNSNGVSLINNNNSNELLQIYNNMKRNPQFQRQFVNAYCLLGGSIFTPERCYSIADSICRLVEPALAIEGKQPWTSYNEQIGNMTNNQSRQARINALRDSYQLGSGMKVKFQANIPQASFMLDNLSVPGNAFDGTLFAPVTLTATAPAGYEFKGWASMTGGQQRVFPSKDTWTYYDQGPLESDEWKTAGYNASNWKQGNAPLGYYTGGARDYQTTLDYGPDASKKYITYYFRKEFNLSDSPAEDDKFTLHYIADDGFVVYVNGVEAYRYLMPDGEIQYSTYATTYANGNPDTGSFSIAPSFFRKGRNVIAVEVHNNVPGSTDIYWEAYLERSYDTPTIINKENQITLSEDVDASYTAMFEPIIDQQRYSATGASPVRINEVSANNGIYVNEYAKRDDWIELYNTTDVDIDIAGMYLSDDVVNPTKYQITGNDGISTIVPAHGTKVIWASKREQKSQLHAPFKLENTDGGVVIIQAEDGTWADALCYDLQGSQQSYGRYPDGGNSTFLMNIPTIEKSNILSTYDNFTLADLYYDETGSRNEQEQEIIDNIQKFAPDIASQIIRTEYFSLNGQKLSGPIRGICICKYHYQNGTIITKKITKR